MTNLRKTAAGDRRTALTFARRLSWLPKFHTVAELRRELEKKFGLSLPELEIERPAVVHPAKGENWTTCASFSGIDFGISREIPGLIGRRFDGLDDLSAALAAESDAEIWLQGYAPVGYSVQYDVEDLKLRVYLGRGPYGAHSSFVEGCIVGEWPTEALIKS